MKPSSKTIKNSSFRSIDAGVINEATVSVRIDIQKNVQYRKEYSDIQGACSGGYKSTGALLKERNVERWSTEENKLER